MRARELTNPSRRPGDKREAVVGGAAGRVVLEQVITGRRSRRVYPDTRFEVDDSLHDFFRRQMESWLQEEDTTWQQVLLRSQSILLSIILTTC